MKDFIMTPYQPNKKKQLTHFSTKRPTDKPGYRLGKELLTTYLV